MKDRAEQFVPDVPPEVMASIRQSVKIAAQWSKEAILDGAADYHATFTELELDHSKDFNDAKKQWQTKTGRTKTTSETSGDCVTRAINEATDGGNYGTIWQELTDAQQAVHPEKNADEGLQGNMYRETFKRYGMKPVVDLDDKTSNVMYRHLYLREIPELVGHLFDDENPLTYIGSSTEHAVAVVDGSVHDIWDSRNMGDTTNRPNGRLTELWLKCDENTANEARIIIDHYTEVRRYDDVLTYGRQRREAIDKKQGENR